MRNGDTFVNYQSFKLMEHNSVGNVLLTAVTLGNINHANWRFGINPQHFSDLAVGCVGS